MNRIPLPNGDARNAASLLVEDRAAVSDKKSDVAAAGSDGASCPYTSLDQLTPEERFPVMGPRHQLDPPKGGKVSLVCCQTTKGPWSIMVHEIWAPLGAKRFLSMVRSNYFSNKVPLMRCIKNFLCQFGLAGPASKAFDSRILDDPNWLPEGPDYRTVHGVNRFAQGYLAYAGAGKDTRGSQLIVSLKPNPRLGGGSPWEVPWGELVGEHSFTTLSKIYTGYGDHGPSQGRLRKEGASAEVAKEFPLLDFVLSCQVVDEAVDS